MKFVYSIIRKDIPLADQIVQSCHSSFHAGERYGEKDATIPSLILLEVKDEEELVHLSFKLSEKHIKYHIFFEPDIGEEGGEFTSLTTEPLDQEQRKVFSNLRLWRP